MFSAEHEEVNQIKLGIPHTLEVNTDDNVTVHFHNLDLT